MRAVVLLLCATSLVAQTVFIQNAMVVDGTGATPRNASVLVRNGRIDSIGDLKIPAGVTIIDAQGKTLLPGMFDLHTHVNYASVGGMSADWEKNLEAYLRCGITTVADFGTYGEAFQPVRQLLESGVWRGPRVLLASRFTTPGGHGAEGGRGDIFTYEVLTPRDARAAVPKALAYKPDVIKVFTDGWRYGAGADMTSMEEATLRVIVEAAHKAGLPLLTHTVTVEKAKIAARAGVDAVMHGVQDEPVDAELIAIMKKNGTAYGPTSAVYEPRAGYVQDELLPKLLSAEAMAKLTARPMLAEPSPARLRKYEILKANTKALFDAGIPVVTGTDSGIVGTHHGWAALRELKLLVDAGLTPLQAIQSATLNAARLVKVDRDRGSIAVGKLADLVLVDGTPFRNISDIDRIERVFLGGVEQNLDALTQSIQSEKPSPITAVAVHGMLDDFESANGRSSIDTLWVNATDPGHDHSRVLLQRILREDSGHALSVLTKMSEAPKPFVRVVLPLTGGAVEPADLGGSSGVSVEVRGEGAYRLIAVRRDGESTVLPFTAARKWKKVRFELGGSGITALAFEIARKQGEAAWLELDNVELYK